MLRVYQDGEWLAFTPLKWENGKPLRLEFNSLADVTSFVVTANLGVQLSPEITDEFDADFRVAMAPVREHLRQKQIAAMESARGVVVR